MYAKEIKTQSKQLVSCVVSPVELSNPLTRKGSGPMACVPHGSQSYLKDILTKNLQLGKLNIWTSEGSICAAAFVRPRVHACNVPTVAAPQRCILGVH